MKRTLCALGALTAISALTAADKCGSFKDAHGLSSVDVAPLPGYVDVCSQDFQLCVKLTQGYPPSVKTIGYFVPADEWQKRQKGNLEGFTHYLIAQRGRTLSADEFIEFKHYVYSQQGNVEDHTKPADVFESQGRVSLGVIDEAEDMIAFGAILKLTQTNPPPPKALLLASINIVLEQKGETLSLYVFDTVKGLDDTSRIKRLVEAWLNRIRERNK
jgi:hypothetical protein